MFSFKPLERCSAALASRPLTAKLQTGVEFTRQRALTVGKQRDAAYSREVRAELLLSPSEMCLAPSSPILFDPILRARAKRTRQGLLTLAAKASTG